MENFGLTESRVALRGLFTAADHLVAAVADIGRASGSLPNRKTRGMSGSPGFLSGCAF